jgi:hypothetical protein
VNRILYCGDFTYKILPNILGLPILPLLRNPQFLTSRRFNHGRRQGTCIQASPPVTTDDPQAFSTATLALPSHLVLPFRVRCLHHTSQPSVHTSRHPRVLLSTLFTSTRHHHLEQKNPGGIWTRRHGGREPWLGFEACHRGSHGNWRVGRTAETLL